MANTEPYRDLPVLRFSLVRGGPLYWLEHRLHIVAGDKNQTYLIVRRMLFALAVGWLPLLLLAILQDRPSLFLSDIAVQGKLLLCVPVLLAAAPYTDGRLVAAVRRMVSESLVPEEQIPYLHDALSAAARRRDSAVAQAVILVAAYVVSFLSVGLGIGADTAMAPHGGPMTPLRLYYGAVSLPLFWFLVVVWIWRFLSWLLVLFRISQLHLSLVPAHSDRTGGMKFLANTQASFSPVVFALGCVYAIATRSAVSGNWSNDALRLTGPQMTYTIGALVVLFAPLAFFSRQLLIAKRDAHERYSELVGRLCRSFEAKWFGRTAPRTGPLGTQDPSSQIDLSSSFDIVESMRWFPFGLRAVVAVVGAGLGALVPRLLLDRELLEALLALKSQIA